MHKQLLRKYRDVKRKKKALEEQESELKDQILKEMEKEGAKKIENEYGTFTVATSAKWKYSEAVEKLKEKMKLEQVKEQQKGVAEKEEVPYLVFTSPKEK